MKSWNTTWGGSRWSRPHWGWRSQWGDPLCLQPSQELPPSSPLCRSFSPFYNNIHNYLDIFFYLVKGCRVKVYLDHLHWRKPNLTGWENVILIKIHKFANKQYLDLKRQDQRRSSWHSWPCSCCTGPWELAACVFPPGAAWWGTEWPWSPTSAAALQATSSRCRSISVQLKNQ